METIVFILNLWGESTGWGAKSYAICLSRQITKRPKKPLQQKRNKNGHPIDTFRSSVRPDPAVESDRQLNTWDPKLAVGCFPELVVIGFANCYSAIKLPLGNGSEDLSSTSTGYWMCLVPCNLGIRRPPSPNQGTKTQTIASNWPKLLGISSAMMDAAKDYARGRRHWFIHLYSFTLLLPPTPGHQDEPPRRCCDVGRVPPHIGWCSFPWIAALYSYWSIAKEKNKNTPLPSEISKKKNNVLSRSSVARWIYMDLSVQKKCNLFYILL